MADRELITKEELNDIREFNEAFDHYHDAQGKYISLMSQGKHCPPDILEQARMEAVTLRKKYENTKVYKIRGGPKATSALAYRFAALIRSFRERNG